MKTPIICFVTDRRQLASSEPEQRRRLIEVVHASARAGVDLIQVRERDLEAKALQSLVEECLEAVRGTLTLIVVNDRLDVAMTAGAAGVHLRADSIAPARGRALMGPAAVIGCSVHTVAGAREVTEGGGADYLVFGTVCPSASKRPDQAVAGVEMFAMVVRATALPVLAIGGMTPDTVPAVAAAGGAGFAGIGFFQAGSLKELGSRVSRARQAFDTGNHGS